MIKNRWMAAAFATATLALAAGCAGGSSTSSLVPGQPAAPTGESTSRLASASAPAAQIRDIETAAKSDRGGHVQDPLANWLFVEPLAVTDQAVFSVPKWVTQCSQISPIFNGLWYVSRSDFSAPLSQIRLPSCTLPSTSSSSDIAGAMHGDAILPSGNGNVYIVELDVGFFSLTTTPVAGPALNAPQSFLLGTLESTLTFSKDHLYAFFLAEWTGTGSPTTQSI